MIIKKISCLYNSILKHLTVFKLFNFIKTKQKYIFSNMVNVTIQLSD